MSYDSLETEVHDFLTKKIDEVFSNFRCLSLPVCPPASPVSVKKPTRKGADYYSKRASKRWELIDSVVRSWKDDISKISKHYIEVCQLAHQHKEYTQLLSIQSDSTPTIATVIDSTPTIATVIDSTPTTSIDVDPLQPSATCPAKSNLCAYFLS
jgi:hypothetical protein